MRRIWIACITLLLILSGGLYAFFYCIEENRAKICLNANDDVSYQTLEQLKIALKKEGIRAKILKNGAFESSEINVYAAENIDTPPKVIDKSAINFLWIPQFSSSDSLDKLKDFDVIVVKSIPSFAHLRAINVRTAYIPDMVDVSYKQVSDSFSARPMYVGDNEGFSLALYLAGNLNLGVDVYGKGFEGVWPKEEIIGDKPEDNDFSKYAIVLVDQSEEDIRDEIVNKKILRTIEKGGVPFVRFNNGVVKMFGNTVPMYANSDEFKDIYDKLLSKPTEIKSFRERIIKASYDWSSERTAKKFIELFEIMRQKRI